MVSPANSSVPKTADTKITELTSSSSKCQTTIDHSCLAVERSENLGEVGGGTVCWIVIKVAVLCARNIMIHDLKYIYDESFEWLLIFQTPDPDQDLLSNVVVTLMKKLHLFYFLHGQFLQLCLKYASEPILVKIWCLKYQNLLKTFIRIRFLGIYWRG